MTARAGTARMLVLLAVAAACDQGQVGANAAALVPGAGRAPAGVATAATGADTTAHTATVPDSLLSEGARLYRAQFCGTCHAFAAAGTAGVFGPPHDSMRVVAERRVRDPSYVGSATTAEAYVLESLTHPEAYRVSGYERTRFLMPAYTQLTGAELDALVQLLLDPATADGGLP